MSALPPDNSDQVPAEPAAPESDALEEGTEPAQADEAVAIDAPEPETPDSEAPESASESGGSELFGFKPSESGGSTTEDAAALFGAGVSAPSETGNSPSEEPAADETAAEAVTTTGAEAPPEVVTENELLAEATEDVENEELPVVAESPFDRPGRWFVVHTQSGYEKKVRQNLEARISSMNMEDSIYEVVIPMEDVVEFRSGKKVVASKKMFPGYLLVRCRLDDDAWYVIRNTPGVTGFVGAGNKPSPLPRRDVETFLAVKPEGEQARTKKTKPRLEYEMGETVRVREGPFADFSGEVIEINEDQLKVKVLVNIFGRETPVELEFAQVAKL